VAILRRLDWLGRLQFADMNEAEDLPVGMEDAMKGMPMRTRAGRVLVGFPAMRRALLQTPLGALPGAILYLPGVSTIGRLVYNWVAAHRPRDACSIGHA
jgi:predicted DCC family thiol-disulfide oxidoreductase YuxK